MTGDILAERNGVPGLEVELGVGARLGEALPERVALVRALPGLGDFLCAVPAFRALRAALPQAHIALIGLPSVRGLADRFGCYLDELIEFPGFPGIPEQPLAVTALPAFLQAMHDRHFDLALQLHGSGATSNPFTVLLGARLTAGCYLPGQYCPDPAHFLPYPESEPEIWRLLRLLAFLGVPDQGDYLEFPVRDEDWQALAAVPQADQLRSGEYACVHPGASTARRRWGVDGFARLADALAAHGLRVVLTGSHQEVALTRAIAGQMQADALDLAGQTSLGALAALLTGARLLVCNDTGVSHLAAALRVPSVVIFSASDSTRWGPLDRQRHRVIQATVDGQAQNLAEALRAVEALLHEEAAEVA